MAKKKTSASGKAETSEPVDDAPVTDELAETAADPEDATTIENDAPAAEEAKTAVEEAPEAEATNTPDEPEELTPEAEQAETPEPEEAPVPDVGREASGADGAGRKGGFAPLLLGGLAAGAIGFGAAYTVLPGTGGDTDALRSDITALLNEQSSDIADLGNAIAALPEAPDMSARDAASADMSAALEALADRLGAVEERFAALDTRLTDVEKRPISEGASDAAVAAYERELQALQDAMKAQRDEIEAMTAQAHSMKDNAEETALATMRRAALTRIQTALDTGVGFAPALGDLEAAGVEVPAALAEIAETGAPSLTQLQGAFPDAARAALGVSRQAAAEQGEQSGFATFLKNQLGTRSLEPREGNDPDAVLSRAEAALREGRLADALAEIEALPDAGREALAGWVSQVNLRQGALAAAEALGQELN